MRASGKDRTERGSPPVNDHVEAGLVLVKCPEATRSAAEDDGHAVYHGLVEVAETETRFLFSMKAGEQIKAFVESSQVSMEQRPEERSCITV